MIMTDPLPYDPETDESDIFDSFTDEGLEAALRKADEDIAAGRVVSHAEVSKWLATWGTPEFGPPPKPWLR